MKILQLLCSRRYCPSNIPQLNCNPSCLQDNSSAWTTQKTQPLYCSRSVYRAHIENTVLVLSYACMLRTLLNNGRCLQSHCLATDLYATVCSIYYGTEGMSQSVYDADRYVIIITFSTL
jgi:hypothetical protein